MNWRQDVEDLQRMARERRRQYGEHDDLAASFDRIAVKIEHDHLKRREREPGESG